LKRRSNSGFTNQQALLAILLVFPLGLIALGLILNVIKRPSLQPVPMPPAAKQTEPLNQAAPNPPSKETVSAEPIPNNLILDLGASVSGEPIRLLLNSIRRGDKSTRAFTYQLGDATIEAMADCGDRSWISYPERRLNRPQSPATEQMLVRVCDGSDGGELPGVATVYDPPSNVRVTPEGAFLCTIDSRRIIRVGQPSGDWYPTSACGREGFMHRSQLQF
jgi:serine/threonine-protein kinase